MNFLGNCACCAGMFVCNAITDCMGASFKQMVRLSYFIFDACFVGFGLLILYGISKLISSDSLSFVTKFAECPADSGFSCLGIFSIYRISMALVVLHTFVLLFLFLRNGCSKTFNEQVWPFKMVIVIGCFIGFFFVSNDFFVIYSKVAMVASLFFLLFQIVMMIDLYYIWGVNWVKKYDEGYNCYAYLLVIFSLIMYGAAFYFIVSSYLAFGGCTTGILTTSVNLVLVVLATILVFLNTNPDGSLLCSSAVSLTSSYLIWSGLSNMEDKTCNTFKESTTVPIVNLVIGIVVIMISLAYVSLGSSEDTSGQMAAGGVDVAQAVLAEAKTQEDDEQKERLDQEKHAGVKAKVTPHDLEVYQTNSYIYFHIIFVFASFYLAMLLTDWGSTAARQQGTFIDFRGGDVSMWIKVATSWIAIFVYNWTLIAPKVFPDRDFS